VNVPIKGIFLLTTKYNRLVRAKCPSTLSRCCGYLFGLSLPQWFLFRFTLISNRTLSCIPQFSAFKVEVFSFFIIIQYGIWWLYLEFSDRRTRIHLVQRTQNCELSLTGLPTSCYYLNQVPWLAEGIGYCINLLNLQFPTYWYRCTAASSSPLSVNFSGRPFEKASCYYGIGKEIQAL